MRKITGLIIFCLFQIGADAQELNGATIGFGFGPSYHFKHPKDYSLSPDGNKLTIQELSQLNFVISSNVTIKFHDLSEKKRENGQGTVLTRSSDTDDEPAGFFQRFAITIGINLGEIGASDISFNKQVDGGIGLAYVFTPAVQLALSFDIIRLRQMRTYFLQYEGKAIPITNGFLNALEVTDNTFFYNKTFSGLSIKMIISLNPKKQGNQEVQKKQAKK